MAEPGDEAGARAADVWLLGPQRFSPCVGDVIAQVAPEGPVATVMAGWQEREPDDEELDALLQGRSLNLALYGRWLDVVQRDPELAEATRERRLRAEEQQALYLLRLDSAVDALRALWGHPADTAAKAAAIDDAMAAVQALDRWHQGRLESINQEFLTTWRPAERPAVAEHRSAVAELLGQASALAIAGGRVDVLAWTLRLFEVSPPPHLPVLGWSAGAMALTETIVLFHDRPVHGSRYAEVGDRGLGLVPGVIALPHARRRLDLDNPRRAAQLARRFAPARCLILEDGAAVRCPGGQLPPSAGPVISAEGTVQASAA